MAYITTKEAAQRLGISLTRVQQLIQSGRLPARKFGPVLQIREADLAKVEVRTVGRPRKETNGK
jgi:excisionase family DNA binding protein